MQGMHPTVGMNGAQGGFPPEGMPMQQVMQQGPAQQFIPNPGMQQPLGYPQYQPGNVPINGQYPQQFAQQQPQGWMPQQPQMQPQPQHPTAPYGQDFAQQQQMQQPQMQQRQPAGFPTPPRVSMNGQEILDGPGVPLELRGRTMAQVAQIYGTLADREVQRQRAGGQQGQAQINPQQPVQPSMQPQVGQPAQPAQPTQSYWQNPAAAVGQQVQQAVQQQIAPLQEYVQRNSIREAQQQAMQTIPDLEQLREYITPILQGMDQSMLADPAAWEGAADLARGRAHRAMQRSQQPQQQMQQQMQRFVPASPQFPQPTHSFFTEGPTPPMGAMNGYGMNGDLSQEQLRAAQGFGMSPDMYKAWQGGQQQGPNQRRF